mmetsp:Transcript_36273/g.92694  ORF Transcript_36273/g.92694 Transcript_36273/m.92694 type:complete len:256 (+) Transcript_36273:1227-1994(+)
MPAGLGGGGGVAAMPPHGLGLGAAGRHGAVPLHPLPAPDCAAQPQGGAHPAADGVLLRRVLGVPTAAPDAWRERDGPGCHGRRHTRGHPHGDPRPAAVLRPARLFAARAGRHRAARPAGRLHAPSGPPPRPVVATRLLCPGAHRLRRGAAPDLPRADVPRGRQPRAARAAVPGALHAGPPLRPRRRTGPLPATLAGQVPGARPGWGGHRGAACDDRGPSGLEPRLRRGRRLGGVQRGREREPHVPRQAGVEAPNP